MRFEGDAAPRFAVGTVIRNGLSVVSQNFFRFFGILLAVGVSTIFLIALAGMMLERGAQTGGSIGDFRFASRGDLVVFVVIFAVVTAVAYFVTQAAIAYGTLQTLRGREAGVGACFSQAFAALPRLFLAGLVLFAVGVVIALVAGLALAAVQSTPAPGATATRGVTAAAAVIMLLMLAVALYCVALIWVFVPAAMVERAGPIACLRRSLELTRGRRWTVFGIVLLIFVTNVVASSITRLMAQHGAPLGGAALNLLVAALFTALSGVLPAIGYAYLRAEKEGAGIDDVVKVFD